MIYDQTTVPQRYSKARALQPDVMALWIKEIQMMTGVNERSVILDLGCGTGRFSFPMAIHYGSTVIGVDPSGKMLSRAKSDSAGVHRRMRFAEGTAESIPVADESADVVFMSMAIHHVHDMKSAVNEIYRVLKKDGILLIRNYISESVSRIPYLSYFPTAMKLSEEMLPSMLDIQLWFAGRFELVSHKGIRQQSASDWGEYVRKIEQRAYSDLVQISDGDFLNGVNEMRSEDCGHTEPVFETVDLLALKKHDRHASPDADTR